MKTEYSLTFSFERETKNTVRYQEDDSGDAPVVGTIYLQKWAVRRDGEYPKKVSVTVHVS